MTLLKFLLVNKIFDFEAYKGWDVSSDKNYKSYKKECEPPWGAIVGRNDKAAKKSAKKSITQNQDP